MKKFIISITLTILFSFFSISSYADNPFADGYYQNYNPFADGYVQDSNPFADGYIQHSNPFADGYVQDKGVFGFD